MSGIKRRGFAMILAIVVVLLIAAGGALVLGNAAKGGKSMGDNYLRAQADRDKAAMPERHVRQQDQHPRTHRTPEPEHEGERRDAIQMKRQAGLHPSAYLPQRQHCHRRAEKDIKPRRFGKPSPVPGHDPAPRKPGQPRPAGGQKSVRHGQGSQSRRGRIHS